jgi:hypothetical protein
MINGPRPSHAVACFRSILSQLLPPRRSRRAPPLPPDVTNAASISGMQTSSSVRLRAAWLR